MDFLGGIYQGQIEANGEQVCFLAFTLIANGVLT